MVDRDPAVSRKTIAKGVALVCGLSTLLMMVQMTALQQLDGGTPGIRGLVVVSVIFAAIAGAGLRRGKPEGRRAADRILAVAAVVYFVTLVGIMAVFDPATHRSASVHQTYGPCHVESTDITGMKRYKFLCAEDFDEDFSFGCVDALPAQGAEWYTVCGRPHTSFARWMLGVSALGLVGVLLYGAMLGAFRRPSG